MATGLQAHELCDRPGVPRNVPPPAAEPYNHRRAIEAHTTATKRLRDLRDLQRDHDERSRYTPVFWGAVGIFIGAGLLHLTPLARPAESRAALFALSGVSFAVGFFTWGSALQALEPLPDQWEARQIVEEGSRPMPTHPLLRD